MGKMLATCLLSGCLVLAAAIAGAQTSGGTGPDGKAAQYHPQRHHEERPFSKPTERAEARLAYIHTALKITDAQEAQWSAFAGKVRQMAAEREQKMQQWREKMAEHKGKREYHRPSVIEHMEWRQKMLSDAATKTGELLEVAKPLYAALSSEQKQVADVVLIPHGKDGAGFGRGRGDHKGRA